MLSMVTILADVGTGLTPPSSAASDMLYPSLDSSGINKLSDDIPWSKSEADTKSLAGPRSSLKSAAVRCLSEFPWRRWSSELPRSLTGRSDVELSNDVPVRELDSEKGSSISQLMSIVTVPNH